MASRRRAIAQGGLASQPPSSAAQPTASLAEADGKSAGSSSGEAGASLSVLVAILPLFLAVVAAPLYVDLRLSYYQYYGIFGLTPERVGLGRVELLSQALTGPAFTAILQVRWVLLAALAALALAPATAWRAHVVKLVAVVVAVALGGSAISTGRALISIASQRGVQAANEGLAIEAAFNYVGTIRVPMLEIEALPVVVQWLDSANRPAVLVDRPECLLLLGRGRGSVYFYNTFNKTLTPLPESALVVTVLLGPTELPTGCRPERGRTTAPEGPVPSA